jgi:uracil phosphoribosyltransferase
MSCHVVDHPLAAHHLAGLRDVGTPPAAFRQHVRQLATLLAVEGSRDLATSPREVRTPLCAMTGARLGVTVGIVPILRAGLGMVEPLLELIPEAQVWHLGLYRDEETALPVEYYSKLPPARPVDVAFVVDPMLATGGSATAALAALRKWGVRETRLLSIIAAVEGVQRVEREFPGTRIHVCAVDPELNSRKFIVPGLGDAGDRSFNTLV